MAEAVDSIIVELTLRAQGYIEGLDRAAAAHGRLGSSLDKLKSQSFDISAEAQKYKGNLDAVSGAEEQTTAKVTRARKARADTAKVAADIEATAAKKSADAVVAAEKVKGDAIAETGRKRRQLEITSGVATQSSGFSGGRNPFQDAAEARGVTGRGAPNANPVNMEQEQAEVAAVKEIDYLTADTLTKQAALVAVRGAEKRELQDQLSLMRLERSLTATGIAEEEILLRLETQRAAVAAARAAEAKVGGGTGKDALRFAEGAGLGRSFGSVATAAGVGAGIAVGVSVEAIESATKFAESLKKVSDAAGISVEGLQVYQHAVEQTGGTADQFDKGLLKLTESLGKARTGSKEDSKIFDALGISLKTGATAGQLLPTLIDRISAIPDAAQRASIGVKLFGESWENIGQALSHGNGQINSLAESLIQTGKVLSSSDIAKLDDVAKKMAALRAELNVDIAQVVANNADAIKKIADSFAELANFIGKAITAYERFANSPIGKTLSYVNNATNPVTYAKNAIGGIIDYYGGPDPKAKPGVPGALGGPVQSGKIDQGKLDNLNTPKGRKGPDLERQEEERQKFINDTLAGFDKQIMSAREATTADELEKAALAREQLDGEYRKTLDDVITNSQLKKLKTEQVDKLRAALADHSVGNDERLNAIIDGLPKGDFKNLLQGGRKAFVARAGAINFQEDGTVTGDSQKLATQQLQLERDTLQSRLALARTIAERRDIELKLLANTEAQQKISDEAVLSEGKLRDDLTAQGRSLASRHFSDTQISEARARAATAGQRHGLAVQEIDKKDSGPFAEYVDKLPNTGKEIGEAFEKAAVSGVERLNDSLATTLEKMTGVHGLAGQILADFIKIALESEEAKLFRGAGLGTGTGAPSASGFLGSISKLLGISGGVGGGGVDSSIDTLAFDGTRAGGGPVNSGGTYLVGEHGPEVLRMGVNGGNITPNSGINTVNPNTRAAAPQAAGTVIQQNITYSGAVDIADKNYVNSIALAQHAATQQAITESGQKTLAATPSYIQRNNQLK